MIVTIVVLIIIIFFGLNSKAEPNEAEDTGAEKTVPAVSVTTAAREAGSTQVSLIGKVRAANEAIIVSESSGKVISVNAKLGQNVSAGQILIQLENQSERAALLQAEGVYEAAVAGSAQADIGVDSAKVRLTTALQSAKTTNQNAYSTGNSIILNTLDVFFANPTTGSTGLRVSGIGNTKFLNTERMAFRDVLAEWKNLSVNVENAEDASQKLDTSIEYTNRILNMVDIFTFIVNDNRGNDGLTSEQENTYKQNLATARTQLIASLNALDNAKSSLDSAQDDIQQAEISASGSAVSLSDAQVKQALGSLRSAQANLNKTIIRSPISGTVNSLDIKLGQFINMNEEVASIANNSRAEIITFVSDKERGLISVGDEVDIEGGSKGTIILIAPAVDSDTRKIEVRISSDDESLLVGDTVRITSSSDTVELSDEIRIPLTALKFSSTDSNVFTVSEDNTLVSVPVTLGDVYGTETIVLSGIEMDTEFVVDARGRNTGEEVVINNN